MSSTDLEPIGLDQRPSSSPPSNSSPAETSPAHGSPESTDKLTERSATLDDKTPPSPTSDAALVQPPRPLRYQPPNHLPLSLSVEAPRVFEKARSANHRSDIIISAREKIKNAEGFNMTDLSFFGAAFRDLLPNAPPAPPDHDPELKWREDDDLVSELNNDLQYAWSVEQREKLCLFGTQPSKEFIEGLVKSALEGKAKAKGRREAKGRKKEAKVVKKLSKGRRARRDTPNTPSTRRRKEEEREGVAGIAEVVQVETQNSESSEGEGTDQASERAAGVLVGTDLKGREEKKAQSEQAQLSPKDEGVVHALPISPRPEPPHASQPNLEPSACIRHGPSSNGHEVGTQQKGVSGEVCPGINQSAARIDPVSLANPRLKKNQKARVLRQALSGSKSIREP
ncbi:hypothetical protein BJ508DRAFT_327444 [Ascobolus immersus RN42]|uniref:Uncharacterized protein n=1 Tax=Ascobolus immersus RN42 TaxID=1160509 RepID=A0A3N4I2W7_ASCIM|nr:hypothetical protein BJ508DRAFT_327444 [Ascobolus immersus RN42]